MARAAGSLRHLSRAKRLLPDLGDSPSLSAYLEKTESCFGGQQISQHLERGDYLPWRDRPGDIRSPRGLDEAVYSISEGASKEEGSKDVLVAAMSEFGQLRRSKVGDKGDRVEDSLGEASREETVDLTLPLASEVLIRFRPWDRSKENGESPDERELRAVERDPRFCCFSFCSLFNSFFALCSPTSSRSGSVQMTSNMIDGAEDIDEANARSGG